MSRGPDRAAGPPPPGPGRGRFAPLRWCDEARLAVMFLTRLPVGRIARPMQVADSVWAWPVAGALLGLCFGLAVEAAAALGLARDPALGLALAVLLLAGGGLHEDGLADLADGIGGGGDPARRLAIMKDSRLGSYGAMALVFALLLGFLGWREIAPGAVLGLAVALGMLSRMALPLWARLFAPPQPGGMAHALRQGLGAGRIALGLGLALAGAGALIGAQALLLAVAVLAVQLGLCLYARARLGGVNGDVLGAGQVLGSLVALLVAGAMFGLGCGGGGACGG